MIRKGGITSLLLQNYSNLTPSLISLPQPMPWIEAHREHMAWHLDAGALLGQYPAPTSLLQPVSEK